MLVTQAEHRFFLDFLPILSGASDSDGVLAFWSLRLKNPATGTGSTVLAFWHPELENQITGTDCVVTTVSTPGIE
jgi:hypothetical protein